MADKKKVQKFLHNLLKIGCVKGFKYFATHVRGREELVCSIINEPSLPILLSTSTSPSSSFIKYTTVPFVPKELDSFLISDKRQRRLSGYGYIDIGLPPASPADSEDTDESCTLFLIACYARYASPYVWVRSNHERLVILSEDAVEKDYPLQLKSTSNWEQSEVELWDVVAELVEVSTSPSPANPFAVDLDYFDCLPPAEKLLASSAMLAFLECVLKSGYHHYNKRVESDVLRVSQRHFHALLELTEKQSEKSTQTLAT